MGAWVALAGSLAALAVLVWQWWSGRRTKKQELLDAIHYSTKKVEKALHQEDYDTLSVSSRDLLDDLAILLRERRSKIPPRE